jgi:SAM-dependent methyltransferase
MEKHAGFKQDEIVEHYDDLCTNYEAIYLRVGFHDPKKCAELSKDTYNLVGKEMKDVDVLDMGCGTGLVGQYLHEYGFRSIVGLDASKGMLKETEISKPNVHKELVELFLGSPSTYPERLHNTFDIVTASGILADNHLDNTVFEEMLLSLRNGGLAIFATRTEYLEKYGYGAYMKMLEDTGKWKFVKNIKFGRYDSQQERVGRFNATEAQGFVYQKI